MAFPNPIPNLAAVSMTGITNATWFTLSSGAPPGATGMRVLLIGGTGGSTPREFRKTGSTDNYVSDNCSQAQQHIRYVGLKAGQNGVNDFDYYSGSNASTDLIYPLEFYGSEATFPTNIAAMASTLTTSYATYSTGGNAPSALAAVFAIHGANDYNVYFRQPGSTDDFSNGNESAGARHWFCGLDGSQQYQAKAGTAGRQPYLVCYWTSNVVVYGTAVDRTPGIAGSYQNLSISGDTSPISHVYFLRSPSVSYTYQLSGQGSVWPAPTGAPPGSLAGGAGAISPAQINVQNVALLVKELAYFTAAASRSSSLMMMGVGG